MNEVGLQIADGNANTVYNLSGCLSSCEKSEFDIRPEADVMHTVSRVCKYVFHFKGSIEYHLLSYQDVWNLFWLKLFLPTTKHVVKEQYVVYDGNTFVADVGGYLGLLLGHSLLGIYRDAVATVVFSMSHLKMVTSVKH